MKPERPRVETREELIALLRKVAAEGETSSWENESSARYVEAVSAWLNDSDGFYENIGEPKPGGNISWQLVADMLLAGRMYE